MTEETKWRFGGRTVHRMHEMEICRQFVRDEAQWSCSMLLLQPWACEVVLQVDAAKSGGGTQ